MPPDSSYRIWFDAPRRLLRWELSGYWSVDTVAAFGEALRQPVTTALRLFPDFACLSDSRGLPVQPAPVMDAIHRLSLRAVRDGRRQAIIVARTLNKIQAERYLPGDLIRVFLEEPPALAWLADRPAPAPADSPIPLMNVAFPPGSATLR